MGISSSCAVLSVIITLSYSFLIFRHLGSAQLELKLVGGSVTMNFQAAGYLSSEVYLTVDSKVPLT